MGADDHLLVFVGGLHRSGTTLIARILAAHPDASGLAGTGAIEDEGQHLQDVYPPAARHGGPGRFALDPAAHLTESSPLVSRAAAERLWAAWSPHWDTSRRVLVEKSPPNLIRARFLQALFPAAAFVMVVRHPVAVTEATRKWARRRPVSTLVRHWATAHRLLLADLDHLRRAIVVRYEDLVADPSACTARLFGFVGLDHQPVPMAVHPHANDAYFQRWAVRWQRLTWRVAVAGAVRYCQPVARHFGYELVPPQTLAWPGLAQ